MDSLWPWLAVAGLGALHGLNPATGWLLAAAWGARSPRRGQALAALLPIAIGHLASMAWVAGAVIYGLSLDRVALQVLAGALFLVLAIVHLSRRTPQRARAPAGHAGLALWSFMASTAHGAGLMLVPALLPLCLAEAGGPGTTASSSLVLAAAAVGVHTAAMLVTTAALAAGTCHGVAACLRLVRR